MARYCAMKFDLDRLWFSGICSHEHDNIFPLFMGTTTAQIHTLQGAFRCHSTGVGHEKLL